MAKKTKPIRDLDAARAERDLGIERVSGPCYDWILTGLLRIRDFLPYGYEGNAEEIRDKLKLGPPPRPGGSGALTRNAMALGLMVRTDKMRPPTDPASHARATYVWRKPFPGETGKAPPRASSGHNGDDDNVDLWF